MIISSLFRRAGNAAIARAGKGAFLAILLVACGPKMADTSASQTITDDSFRQWKLPRKLHEVSGLALTRDNRLLAITDEEAVVYEIDYESGRLVKAFAFGDPVVRGDFEGIAVLHDKVWLMTSQGRLFSAREGANGERVQFQQFDTGLGKYCELEGLAQDRDNGLLALACKETRSKNDQLKIFELSVTANGISQVRDIKVPEAAIADEIESKHVNPSGIAIAPDSGQRTMVAARQRAIMQLSSDGELIDAIILPKKKRHRQAEGVEITADGRLLIADEGGDGKARLAIYRLAPSGIIKTE
jgi:uncharacterized protein YjiK